MRRAAFFASLLIAGMLVPVVAQACVFPNSLRMVNKTLSDQIARGGEVGGFVRNTLARALSAMPPGAMENALQGEISRADMRATREVLATAALLADGRGLRVDPELRVYTTRLGDAIETACADGDHAASGTGEATAIERGTERKAFGGGTGLTFGEGMARLSIAFSIYAAFLVALFVFRQFYHRHYLNTGADVPDVPAAGSEMPDAGASDRAPAP
ncbi:MAG: hypothetical protein AAF727_11740 [Pseudomonadota bacterium]